jgi:hypothetical protein
VNKLSEQEKRFSITEERAINHMVVVNLTQKRINHERGAAAMTLLELQRKMAAAITRPLTTGYEMQEETEDGRFMSIEAESFIKPSARATSFERLEIYNQQYWFRVMSALRDLAKYP